MGEIQEYNEGYIKQCTKACELMNLKLKSGFCEGDYVFDGAKVRLVGHDFINLTEKFDKMYPHFQFAMLKADDKATINSDDYPSEIHMQYGEYSVDTIYHPVWIPTQSQLQELMPSSNNITMLHNFLSFLSEHNERFNYTDSQVQMWLKFVMYNIFNKLWSPYSCRWVLCD